MFSLVFRQFYRINLLVVCQSYPHVGYGPWVLIYLIIAACPRAADHVSLEKDVFFVPTILYHYFGLECGREVV